MDNCGRLPLLVKRGFRREIITSAASRECLLLTLGGLKGLQLMLDIFQPGLELLPALDESGKDAALLLNIVSGYGGIARFPECGDGLVDVDECRYHLGSKRELSTHARAAR